MKRYLNKIKANLLSLAALITLAFASTSCDAIYDDQGDCDPKYFVRFSFDMNMEYADAFKEQVHSVEVWVFNQQTKEIADHVTASGDALKQEGFLLPLNITPGDYHLVAWCNLEGNRHFKVEGQVNHFEDPAARMTRNYDEKLSRQVSKESLDELFHGIIDFTAPSDEEMYNIAYNGHELKKQTQRYGTQTIYDPQCYWDEKAQHYKAVYTVSLIRNTNNIVLSLEHLSGEFNLEQLAIEMTDNNGTMLHDNRIDERDEMITYLPWRVATGTLEQGTTSRAFDINDEGNKDGKYADFITSELSTARMTPDHDKQIRIYYKDTGETVFQLPLNKWISQLRSQKYQNMDEQEYLDRENNFDLMVFLQDDGRGGWTAVQVVINGWHIIDNGDVDI